MCATCFKVHFAFTRTCATAYRTCAHSRTQDRNSYFEVIWWGIDRNKSTILIDSSRIASGTSLKLVITLVGSCIKIKVTICLLGLGMAIPWKISFLEESRSRGIAIYHSSGIEEDKIYSSGFRGISRS